MTEQRQDSLLEQLRDVVVLAEQNGCYDAADWIRRSLEFQLSARKLSASTLAKRRQQAEEGLENLRRIAKS